ncbi:MAG: hypothetical protein ACLFR0_03405 [Alphaproteobacteria bacterium]
MSETGSTNFPARARFDKNADSGAVKTLFNASLIGVPNVAKGAEQKVVHIKGEVIQHNKNGQVRIQSDKGIVEIQLPKDSPQNTSPLPQGQRVSIEIPPKKVRQRNPESVKVQIESAPQAKPAPKSADLPAQTNRAARPNASQSRDEIITPPVKTDLASAQSAQKNANTVQNTALDSKILSALPKNTAIPLSAVIGETIRIDPVVHAVSVPSSNPPLQDITQFLPVKSFENPPALSALSTAISTIGLQTVDLLQAGKPSPLPPINAFFAKTDALSPLDLPSLQTPQSALILEKAPPIKIIAPASAQEAKTILPFVPETPALAFKTIAAQFIQLRDIPPALQMTKAVAEFQAPILALKTDSLSPIIARIETLRPPEVFVLPSLANQGSMEKPPLFPQLFEKVPERILLDGAPSNNTLSAVIIGKSEKNLPIIAFPSLSAPEEKIPQNFILQVPVQDSVIGQRLDIALHSSSPPLTVNIASLQNALPSPAYFLTPGQWPLLEDIAQSLQQNAGALSGVASAAQSFTSVLPNAASPSQIPPAALFFIAALRAGDLSGILGERAQSILKTQGKGNLISRLTQEGQLIARTEQSAGEWRSLTLPMAFDQDIQKIALHYKYDHPKDGDSEKGAKQTRFIFDLALTRMGKVQLDGLHRDNRLNMIIRTEQKISSAMQAVMKQGYHTALEGTNLSGDLSFQGNLDGWMKISAQERGEFASDI